MRFDIQVDGIEAAEARVLEFGARLLAVEMSDPDAMFRVYADPAGHPLLGIATATAAGTALAAYSREDLDVVTAELNPRPRKTLGWETPAERLGDVRRFVARMLGDARNDPRTGHVPLLTARTRCDVQGGCFPTSACSG